MFARLGRLVTRYPWAVVAAWIALAMALTVLAPAWDARAVDDDIHFLPARCDSVRGYQLLAEAFPQDVFASRAVLVLERTERTLDEADLALADRLAERLEQVRAEEPGLQVGRIASRRDPFLGQRLLSRDGHCTLIQVALGTPFLAAQTRTTVDRLETVCREVLPEGGPRLLVTGAAGVGRDLVAASGRGLEGTTAATVVLVLVLLLLVYRAPLLALVPLVTIGVSVWVALRGLALLTLLPGVYLVNVAQVFAVVLLYGAGTDYCLFLISRYREELAGGRRTGAALRRSVGTVGGALTASAGTVILGLGLMVFAEFAKVRCAGPAIALALAVALAASLTLTPALLRLLGRTAFWPGRPPARLPRHAPPGVWDRVSQLVVARPATVFVACVLVLAPLAAVGLRLRPDFKPTGELAPAASSVQGLAVIRARFTAGETGPFTVLLTARSDWGGTTGREALEKVCTSLENLDNVAEVRSYTRPLGRPLPAISAGGEPGASGLGATLARTLRRAAGGAEQSAREHYLAARSGADDKYVARVDVVPRTDPFAAESLATLQAVQAWLADYLPMATAGLGPVGSECYGPTVHARDLAEVTSRDRGRINLLVLGGTFLLLVVLVRKAWLAGYLLATVLLSYLVTLGATALAGMVWSGRPLTEVDWRVPFFLFTILVAVGEDYNILLITRALEERRRHGPDRAIRRALARTGGTITSCGLIMAGTFGTLMLAGLGTLVQCGFALAFGVLLDTFVVRPFLVPAFTLLVWRYEAGVDVRKKARSAAWIPGRRNLAERVA